MSIFLFLSIFDTQQYISLHSFLHCIIFSFVAILLNCHRFIGSTINIFYHFQFSRFSLLFRSGFFTTSNYKYFSRERKREREREREKEKGLDAMQSRERHTSEAIWPAGDTLTRETRGSPSPTTSTSADSAHLYSRIDRASEPAARSITGGCIVTDRSSGRSRAISRRLPFIFHSFHR